MRPDPSPLCRNQLLRSLSEEDRCLLTSRLAVVMLSTRYEIERPGQPIDMIVFPDSGIVSIVAHGAQQKQIEVGIVGREGMTGLAVVLGGDCSPHSTYVQIAGEGQRIAPADLRAAMEKSSTLRNVLLRFAQTFMVQTTYTAVSNASAKLEERLARWLLMAHDRVDGDDLPLIHEFLALMLGVRRPGVTVAIHSLESHGLIRTGRGTITVVDRKGLEEVANTSYGIPEAEYARLL